MLIVGTAGHIDHGKTTLSTTITGVATDRLKEEQSRGISIELGFAHFQLSSGEQCGLIDVPGHEKFVRQMIAGAVGIDMVLLVIAADEGMMPQTREHLDICRLLGIQHGAVVLTKVDLVEEEWLELVEEDIREFTAGTFLEGKPIWHFSPHRENLVTDMKSHLDDWICEYAKSKPAPDDSRPFKLSLDRVFSMKGFGTVVTGTVTSGVLNDFDELISTHSGVQSKVRGIQVHGNKQSRAATGSRAAINLQGVEKAELKRGDVLTRKDELVPTSMIDVEMTLVSSLEKTVQKRSKVLLHIGTTQLVATLVLLGQDAAQGGDHVFAQLRLERPTIVLPGEHFILRGFEVLANYGKTFAGGSVLDPHPKKHKGPATDVVRGLKRISDEGPSAAIEEIVKLSGDVETSEKTIWRRVNCSKTVMQESIRTLEGQERLLKVRGQSESAWLHQSFANTLQDKAQKLIQEFHEGFPTRLGMPREELRSRLRYDLEADVMDAILKPSVEKQQLAASSDTYALFGFEPNVDGETAELLEKLESIYLKSGLEPPLHNDCSGILGVPANEVKEASDVLIRQGKLIHVKGPLYFATSEIQLLQEKLIAFLRKQDEITTLEFKEMTGVSRKYAIPLAEYFDAKKITLRAGNAGRRLRPGI